MNNNRLKNMLLIAVMCIVCMSSALYGQDAQELEALNIRPETPEFEQDVSVTLQLIDVVVRDNRGNYVNNLTRDDFVVRVNGEVLDIKTFDAYFRGQRGGIEDLATGTIPDQLAPARRLILFFDQAYTSFRGIRKAKVAAIEFVKRNLSPGDLVMIIGYERSFKIYQDFTRDREKLVDAINNIKFAMVAGNRTNTRFEGENVFNVRQYLTAMEKLGLFLDAWRGRKTLIMLSEGFDQALVLRSLNIYQREMLEQFNDSNTTVYSLDVAGLSVPGTGGGNPGFQANRLRRRHDTLSVFANETGGKFYSGNNNIEKLLLEIDDDISNYYVLGVYTRNQRDGNFREIDVEVKGNNYEVDHRRGFFAPKPFEDMGSDERTIQLEAGFNRPVPVKEFDARFSTLVFPRNDGSAVAGIVVNAPLTASGKQEFELLGYVYDKEEKPVDVFHKRFYFSGNASGNSLHHVQTVLLEPGANLIKMVVRDNRTGERCYNFVEAFMPALDRGMHVSTIGIVETGGTVINSSTVNVKSLKRDYPDAPQSEPADPLSPLTRSEGRLAARDYLQVRSTEQLVIKVSGIESGVRYQERLNAVFALMQPDGAQIPLPSSNVTVMAVPGSEEAIITGTIDLSGITPGLYVLTVTVKDTETEQTAQQRREIQIR